MEKAQRDSFFWHKQEIARHEQEIEKHDYLAYEAHQKALAKLRTKLRIHFSDIKIIVGRYDKDKLIFWSTCKSEERVFGLFLPIDNPREIEGTCISVDQTEDGFKFCIKDTRFLYGIDLQVPLEQLKPVLQYAKDYKVLQKFYKEYLSDLRKQL